MKSLGLRLPLIPNNKGNLDVLRTSDEITDQNIKNFIKTSKGSRIMNRKLGLGLRRYLGEFLNDSLRNRISEIIEDNLRQRFHNLKNLDVIVEQNQRENYDILVSYSHKNDFSNTPNRSIKIKIQ